MDGLPRVICGAGTSSDTVRHKAAVHHPVRGGDGGLRLRRGLRHLRMALWDAAGGSPAAAGDQRLCLWKPRFGQRAAGWQEVSARNFVSEQGPASPPYWMYGKKLGRSYGAKGPATPAVTPVVSCPIEKKSSKTFIFWCFGGKNGRAAAAARPPLYVLYCILE